LLTRSHGRPFWRGFPENFVSVVKPTARIARLAGTLGIFVLSAFAGGYAQSAQGHKSARVHESKSRAAAPKISLAPRFVPGQSFRYEMEFETTNDTARSGLATDPQGPRSVVVDWNATLRMDVLPAEAAPGGIRLRTTYEKSTATVRSDTFDPSAEETTEQYHQLEGKVIEFTLGADGKVSKVTGIEAIADSEKAAQAVKDWIAQLGAGAPPGGVSLGQTWSDEEPATGLPIAGLVWRADSEYVANEPCHPPNPDVPGAPASADEKTSAAGGNGPPDCAVILAKLSLAKPKSSRESTPPDLRGNGMQSAGSWTGSTQSLIYVSLESGMVVSSTQTGSQEMDVTLTTSHNTRMRVKGTISTRSQVTLVTDEAGGN